LVPGADVMHASDPGQPSGELVMAAASPTGGWHALAEVKLSALNAGPGAGLQFSSAGVDMEVRDLPYPIPSDAP
jgi:tRNA-modifying protein YgfZ